MKPMVEQYQVDYGNGWEPVEEERARRILANAYHDVEMVVDSMRNGLEARSALGTWYRIVLNKME